MSTEIRGLSLIQPWAGLVALGAKKIETRSWKNPYRGLLAIHATKVPTDDETFRELVAFAGISPSMAPPALAARGAIVAVARVADIISSEFAKRQHAPLGSPEQTFGDYGPGRWAWLLADIVQIEVPIQCRGFQGLFPLPRDVEDQVRERLARRKR